jgi:hypothetical protein
MFGILTRIYCIAKVFASAYNDFADFFITFLIILPKVYRKDCRHSPDSSGNPLLPGFGNKDWNE